jgi:glycosyltransferase involved in cell wall biosynthesis
VNAVRRAAALLPDRFDVSVHDVRPGLRNAMQLRRLIREAKPDVVHAVGPDAANALAVCRWTGAKGRSRFVVGGPRLTPALSREPDEVPLGSRHLLPDKFVLAAGGFDGVANLKAAVWAFDMLKYTDPQLHLVLLGDGPQRQSLEKLARGLGHDDYRLHFAGFQPDVRPYLHRAAVVWVTHTTGGTHFALEAMAAGKPVVVGRRVVPFGDDLKTAGEECLVRTNADEPYVQAAVTRELLSDPERMCRLGEAGRRTAARYPLSQLVDELAAEYDSRVGRTA